jgi:hypothetical protein
VYSNFSDELSAPEASKDANQYTTNSRVETHTHWQAPETVLRERLSVACHDGDVLQEREGFYHSSSKSATAVAIPRNSNPIPAAPAEIDVCNRNPPVKAPTQPVIAPRFRAGAASRERETNLRRCAIIIELTVT